MASDASWEAAQEGAELIAEGEHERAITLLEEVLRADPRNEHALYYLGAACYERGDHAKALRAYVDALGIAPGYLGAMIGAGQALRMLGRYDQAIRMGQQVLARDERDLDALFLIGASFFARGDNAAAERYLEQFLAAGPELEAATEATGMLQVIRGEVFSAVPSEEPD
jgi:tetratricopeptide (TPR) repeat protein